MNRRNAMAITATAGIVPGLLAHAAPDPGSLRQSIVAWCWRSFGPKWTLSEVCQAARDSGCVSVELVPPDEWTTLKKYGLVCAIATNNTGWAKGFNNPAILEEVRTKTTQAIEDAAKGGIGSVIGFVGSKYVKPEDPKSGIIARDEGYKHCVKELKVMALAAEKHKVTLCIEHLNSRDDSHPMKGHPEYMGDNLDEVEALIKEVGSPRIKILFDIYHVQIMHGDLVRRIKRLGDLIGHVHTAGNPGRCELDPGQEIQYKPVMQALWDVGYRGFIGHEFLPTKPALNGLIQAITTCAISG